MIIIISSPSPLGRPLAEDLHCGPVVMLFVALFILLYNTLCYHVWNAPK